MTIREAMQELETYPYSIECYELMKESMELELMAHYLESYEFYEENKEYEHNISESVKVLFENAKEPNKEGFFKKLLNGIIKILGILLKPFALVYKCIYKIMDKIITGAVMKTKEFFVSRDIKRRLQSIYVIDGKVDKNIGKEIIDKFKTSNQELYNKIMNGNYNKASALPRKIISMLGEYLDKPEHDFVAKMINFIYGPNIKVPKIFIAIDKKYNSLFDGLKEDNVEKIIRGVKEIFKVDIDKYEIVSADNIELVLIGIKYGVDFIKEAKEHYSKILNSDNPTITVKYSEVGNVVGQMQDLAVKVMPLAKDFISSAGVIADDVKKLSPLLKEIMGDKE